ncbi:hypothetical protein DNU06_09335 [Putridiphycobacter roseus]|uniref:DUF2851 domain-containing protein n=1 Tax=Putridiphycobacter roseus TaxID=2219161 RepID=A0A2W1NCX6_9FLAO|nr:DUF2851 family protein [Putridiphycobacter roseus]PZE16943.1 hypothetical protein DNU06_09335 [Putridiphycobacter roseus]
MQEEYLHYLFHKKYFGRFFKTAKGVSIEVIDHGVLNTNAGPDFLEAKIKFDGKIWAGPIEFHVKSSDWLKHKHQFDTAYNNVIAHFVYENDMAIYTQAFELPTVELKSFINIDHFTHYQKFKNSKAWVQCAQQLGDLDDFILYQQKEKAFLERMFRKSTAVLEAYDRFAGDESSVMLHVIAKVFGGKVNQEPFMQLVAKIDWQHFRHFHVDLQSFEAYCFGLAGFLNFTKAPDAYAEALQNIYGYQKKMWKLEGLKEMEWKFSRMHPAGFPTVRIAQFASLLKVLYKTGIGNVDWENFDAQDIAISIYWQTHYHFAKTQRKSRKSLSKDFKYLLYINAYIPFLFAKGIRLDRSALKEHALEAMNHIPAEKNTILKNWSKVGVQAKTAFDSQSLIEMKNEYCKQQRCLQCKIGQKLIGYI